MKLRLAGAVLTALVLVPVAWTQGATEVEIPLDWQVGQKYRLRVQNERMRLLGEGKSEVQGKSATPVDVEVTGSSDEGYTIVWTYGEPEVIAVPRLEALSAEQREHVMSFARRLTQATSGHRLVIRTDAMAVPQELENVEEVMTRAREFTSALRESMQELQSEAEARQFQEAIKAAEEMFMRRDVFEPHVLQVPNLFYLPCGAAAAHEPGEYETEISTPWGTVAAVGSLRLMEVSGEGKTARLHWQQSADPAQLKAMVLQAMKNMAERMGRPPIEGLEKIEVESREEATYEVELSSGLPLSVAYTRTISTAGQGRVDRIHITREQD